MEQARIVIIGAGFGGLYAARELGRSGKKVVLIDRTNYHLFQPLLYQVATGYLAPGDIATPIRSVLANLKSVSVIHDEVLDLDPGKSCITTRECTIEFDYLLLASGVTYSYFGNTEWSKHAPGLKTVQDAVEMRCRILGAFEAAERSADEKEQERLLTTVIIGGGPTGVELAGAVAELSRGTLKGEFRRIDPQKGRIFLVDSGERILSGFHPNTSAYAKKALEKLGVTVLTNTMVTDLGSEEVKIMRAGSLQVIPTGTILWAAGVQASALAKKLAERTGVTLDRSGRVEVEPNLSIKGYPNVFVLGDLASCKGANGELLPGVAPVAMQQGSYVAKVIVARIRGRDLPPFRYFDKGNMAVIGRGHAVAEYGRLRINGFSAWVAWAIIHIYFLIEFENKLIVFIHWAWNYMTNGRGSRLITKG